VFAARVVRNATQSERRRSDSAAATATVGRGKGRRVTLTSDPTQDERDRYGRLLAYVYRADDGTFVNLALAQEGYAQPLTIPPNVAYASQFSAAAAGARTAGRGLWGTCQ
jgi:micrococcal nuclease